jgi:hypothetical protein
MLLPVILERRLGDVPLPEGSIVFATTNLSTDGVGDNIPPHAYNRMTVCDFANPSVDDWITWGSNNGVVPEVLAFYRWHGAGQISAVKWRQVLDALDGQRAGGLQGRGSVQGSHLRKLASMASPTRCDFSG